MAVASTASLPPCGAALTDRRPSTANGSAMSRVAVGRAPTDQKALNVEIARLRDLDTKELRARWRTVFRREAPPHLARHLLFRVLAYRLQADALGDLNDECQRLLDRAKLDGGTGNRTAVVVMPATTVAQGTILCREWAGRMHRVAVLADGFAWNGKIYPSLSKVAGAITGTRWNGPRFFGLRDKHRPASSGSKL